MTARGMHLLLSFQTVMVVGKVVRLRGARMGGYGRALSVMSSRPFWKHVASLL
jgi:hypothetical protein